jgi:hypothetical protein
MRTFPLLWISLSLLVVQACGSKADGGTGTGAGGGAASSSSSTGSGGGGTGTGGGGAGPSCSPAAPCMPGFFCQYADSLCGKGLATGTCLAVQPNCGNGTAQGLGCGCDGQLAPSCFDGQTGTVDQGPLDACVQPEGTFVCGSYLCELSTQYCLVSNPDGCGDVYACTPYPTQCLPVPTCACVHPDGSCMGDSATGMNVIGIQGDSPQCP